MTEGVAVVAMARTPMARRGGPLAAVHPVDLLASVYREVLRRGSVDPQDVEDVLVGCVSQMGDQSFNIGRQAWLAAGLPIEVPAASVNMMCGSSQRAVMMAHALIASGQRRVVLVGGVESMSRNPLDAEQQLPEGTEGPFPPSYRRRYEVIHQGEAAERIADRWQISRQEVDAYAARSHYRAWAHRPQFAEEVMPVAVGGQTMAEDATIRPDTSPEGIGQLPPVFRPDGRLSAGSSSQVVDGAAAMLLADRGFAQARGWPVEAAVLDHVVVGSDPVWMLTGPIPATRRLLTRNALSVAEVGWYEVNEAFATVPLAWQRELGAAEDRLNPAGGAIALGHPLGASGVRLLVTLITGLRRRGGGYGVSTMCVGGGIGTASLVKV
jgi:acetyl-CoA acyltransferase